jgi:hypothetical protein
LGTTELHTFSCPIEAKQQQQQQWHNNTLQIHNGDTGAGFFLCTLSDVS